MFLSSAKNVASITDHDQSKLDKTFKSCEYLIFTRPIFSNEGISEQVDSKKPVEKCWILSSSPFAAFLTEILCTPKPLRCPCRYILPNRLISRFPLTHQKISQNRQFRALSLSNSDPNEIRWSILATFKRHATVHCKTSSQTEFCLFVILTVD